MKIRSTASILAAVILCLSLLSCAPGATRPTDAIPSGSAVETGGVTSAPTAAEPSTAELPTAEQPTAEQSTAAQTPTEETAAPQTPPTQTTKTKENTPTEAPSTSEPTPSSATLTPTPTETPLTIEEQRDLDDRAFLAAVSFPKYEPGEEGEIFFSGRWYEKEIDGVNHHVTVTDGAQAFFLVRGSRYIDVVFTLITQLETPWFAYSIDGKDPVRQKITEARVELPDEGRHILRIVADGITENEKKLREIGFAFKGIDLPEGGSMRAVIPQNKLVFFYGDSITEGVLALKVNNKAEGNSATGAYPWFLCREVGAIPYYIGYGATGVKMTGSFHNLYYTIDHLSLQRKVDFALQPDLIIINHGTNDSLNGVASDVFKKDLKKALLHLQECYPGVPIVVMIPFGQYFAKELRAVCAETEGVTVMETKNAKMTGDGLHPFKETSKKGAKILAQNLLEIVGEEFFK